MKSVFDSDEFVAGFLDFYESAEFGRYMVPFITEYIGLLRDKLENVPATEICELQGRIKAAKQILLKAGALKQEIASKKQGESN